MSCNEWIDKVAKGHTFADVGGLWGTVNERVTVAAKAGAVSTAMIDLSPPGSHLWDAFYMRCSEMGVTCDKSIITNVDAPDFAEKAGKYDVVHCSGVIYHCPNPLFSVSQLTKITGKYLILASTVVPTTLINAKGVLKLEDSSSIFVPSMSARQKKIVNHHFSQVGAKQIIPDGVEYSFGTGDSKYAPWWHLFTQSYVAGLLNTCGAEVMESSLEWEGRVAYFLARIKSS